MFKPVTMQYKPILGDPNREDTCEGCTFFMGTEDLGCTNGSFDCKPEMEARGIPRRETINYIWVRIGHSTLEDE